jgi:hypothetical protein
MGKIIFEKVWEEFNKSFFEIQCTASSDTITA